MDGPPAPEPVPHLTPRELEVLRLMCRADCLLEKQMPDVLGMSLSTFKTHRESVYAKCKVKSREQLIVKAVRWKLVECFCGGSHPQGNTAASLGDTPPTDPHDGAGLPGPSLNAMLWGGILLKMLEIQCQLGGDLFVMPEMLA